MSDSTNSAHLKCDFDINTLKYDSNGLIPAIAQDVNGAVLMLAYMNAESLRLTIETGYATYYSRSRQELWKKGGTSGNVQRVLQIRSDCDNDALLLTVEQTGVACHTGAYSCFFNDLAKDETAQERAGSAVLDELFGVITERKLNPKPDSYTYYLFKNGVEKISKKVGEEASETIIAAIKGSGEELRYEAADLIYHLWVLLAQQGLTPEDIYSELKSRRS